MKKMRFLPALILMLAAIQSFGQFSLKAEFRPRVEYRGGYGIMLTQDQQPAFTISQRSRLSAYYQNGIFSAGMALQDVRVWGDDDTYSSTGVSGSKASIDLNEAWIGIRAYKNGLVKIGRQYWSYEDQRILSSRGWNQSEIKYDALLLSHKTEKWQADLGLSWNNNQEKSFGNEYPSGKMKSLNFIYLKKQLTDWMYLSGMGILSGFTPSDTVNDINWQGTYGLYAGIKKGRLSALASGYYQSGQSRSGMVTRAYLVSANAEYKISGKFSLGAGIDYLSGTDQDNADADYRDKNHTFDVFYGIRHGAYGHLDYFSNLPKSTGNGGLSDIFIKMKYMITEKANIGADLHYFSLQNNVLFHNEELLAKSLGEEIDLYFQWDILKFLNVRGGYSTFFATESMEKLQGVYGNARFPHWVWVMITAKPVFLDAAQK